MSEKKSDVNMDFMKSLLRDAENLKYTQMPLEETNYYCSEKDYDAIREDLRKKFTWYVRRSWNEIHQVPEYREAYADVIAFSVTINELFEFVDNVCTSERVPMSRYLIEKFQGYVGIIHTLRQNGCVELSNNAEVLKLRDDVLKEVQNIYRIAKPMEERKEIKYPRTDCDRYCVHDYDWLCGSITSGPDYFSCLKYISVSRPIEYELVTLRQEILAAQIGIPIVHIGDVTLPIPQDLNDPDLLARCLDFRETMLRDKKELPWKKLHDHYETSKPEEYVTGTNFSNMHLLQSLIREERRDISNEITTLPGDWCIGIHLHIGVLAAVQTQMLLVQKVYAPYVDSHIGMYYKYFSEAILRKIFNLHFGVSGFCNPTVPIAPTLETNLAGLRLDVYEAIKEFYTKFEEICENHYNGKHNGYDKFKYSHKFTEDDLPNAIQCHKKAMIDQLNWQEIEMERLYLQLKLVKNGYKYWPKTPTFPVLTTNIHSGKIIAFVTNVDDLLPLPTIDKVTGGTFRRRDSKNYRAGNELAQIIRDVVREDMQIPTKEEIDSYVKKSIQRLLLGDPVDRWTSKKYAELIAEFVYLEVEITAEILEMEETEEIEDEEIENEEIENEEIENEETESSTENTAAKIADKVTAYLSVYLKGRQNDVEQHYSEWIPKKRRRLDMDFLDQPNGVEEPVDPAIQLRLEKLRISLS